MLYLFTEFMRTLTICLLFIVSSLPAQPFKVMTYNIRYDNPGDGVNKWDSRKSKVYDLIQKYDADLISSLTSPAI